MDNYNFDNYRDNDNYNNNIDNDKDLKIEIEKDLINNLPAVREQSTDAVVSIDSHLLQRYLLEINKYPLLSKEEEDRLTRLYYETKDPEIAKKIITSNLRLVVKISLDFQKFWMRNFIDLIQEGNVGLIQAVKKFDPFKGVKFSYYASFWIKAYLLKFIMDNWRLVKIGTTQTQRKLFYNLNKEKEKISKSGIVPELELLTEKLNATKEEIQEMEQRLNFSDISLDASISEDSEDKYIDFIPSNEEPIDERLASSEVRKILSEKINEFIKTLSDKERVVFEKRLFTEDPVTLNELGNEFNVSRERIRQIETKLKNKLLAFLREHIPDIDAYVKER